MARVDGRFEQVSGDYDLDNALWRVYTGRSSRRRLLRASDDRRHHHHKAVITIAIRLRYDYDKTTRKPDRH